MAFTFYHTNDWTFVQELFPDEDVYNSSACEGEHIYFIAYNEDCIPVGYMWCTEHTDEPLGFHPDQRWWIVTISTKRLADRTALVSEARQHFLGRVIEGSTARLNLYAGAQTAADARDYMLCGLTPVSTADYDLAVHGGLMAVPLVPGAELDRETRLPAAPAVAES